MLCLSVERHLLVRLVAVAVEAGQGQIFGMVFAAFGDWNDMIYRKENILPGFIGVAVLAQKAGAQANLLLNRGGEFMGHRLTLESFEIAPDSGLGDSANSNSRLSVRTVVILFCRSE